jgi:hypothetical protein
MPMTQTTQPLPPSPSANVRLDLNLPLWGVITTFGGGFVMLVGLFFNVAALTASVKDLQITVQAGNTAYSSLASRTTLLEFRAENNASEIKQITLRLREKETK